jgi:hypothetical protein
VDLQTIGRGAVALGVVLLIVGGLLWFAGRMGLGSLPGDIPLSGPGWSAKFPLATSIVLSLLLTVVLNIVWRMFNR